jgi:hypothetical protein
MELKDILTIILFVLFWIYDGIFVHPYFWVKVAFGIATGLVIPSRIVSLLACAIGNAALFMYTPMGAKFFQDISFDAIALVMWCSFAFAGLVWWVVGRVLRRIYLWLKAPNGSGATT